MSAARTGSTPPTGVCRRSFRARRRPNRDLTYIGISGDGDSLSIGLGQMCHAIRRNIRMLYVIENNGVYGLTKGQFSASADRLQEQARRAEPDGADRSGAPGFVPGRDVYRTQVFR